MNNKTKIYSKLKYLTFFVIVIGFFLPYTSTAQNQDKSSLPTINSFVIKHKTTDEVNGKKTNWIEFSWEAEGADKVRLYRDGLEIKSRSQRSNGEMGWPLSLAGGFKIHHKKSAVYELVAENNMGKVSEKSDVKMKKKRLPPISKQPEILDFRVEPQNIKTGDQVSFYWQVKNAYKVLLYDNFGEIKSRIKLPKGNYGWPLFMNAIYKENLNKSEIYKLVAIGKKGSVTKSVKVIVNHKKCKLVVSVTGIYSKNTDGVGVYKVTSGGKNEFLFKTPIKTIKKGGLILYRATISLTSGKYLIAPYGGGKYKYGFFGVMYKPRSINYTCKDGNTKYITFKADGAEY